MEIARITARGQTTIPKSIREAANLHEGEGDHVVIRKVTSRRDDYLYDLSEVLGEWVSSEDEEAWRDL